MRSWVFALTLLLTAPASARETPAAQSRYGRLELRPTPDGPASVYFRGKVIFEAGGESLEIHSVLHGAGRDHVLVAIHSGEIACPTRFVLIDLEKSGRHRTSPEFGSCSPVVTVRLRGDAVVAETPIYTPHPELIPDRELERRNHTKVVYTWRQGKLSQKEAPDR